jgi:hypothetical protein
MTRWLMWTAVVGLVFAGVAGASVKQGDTELDFLGGFTTQNSAGATATQTAAGFDSWFISAALGYFLTDNIQVQGAAMGAWTSVTVDNFAARDNDVDVDVYGLGVRGKYHFMPTNQWVPYVGAQLLWVQASVDASDFVPPGAPARIKKAADSDRDGTLWGPLAGLRYELNENNDFFVEYQYQMWGGDIGDFFDDGHGLFVGIVHQFK